MEIPLDIKLTKNLCCSCTSICKGSYCSLYTKTLRAMIQQETTKGKVVISPKDAALQTLNEFIHSMGSAFSK